MNPLRIGFRAIATILALVFLFDGLFEPDRIALEDAREWQVASHGLFTGNGRTNLKLESQYGHQVKVNCETYRSLCEFVESNGSAGLRVWVADLGYYKSASLVKATVGDNDLVSLAEAQRRYEASASQRESVRLLFLALAVFAWRQPLLKVIRRRGAT